MPSGSPLAPPHPSHEIERDDDQRLHAHRDPPPAPSSSSAPAPIAAAARFAERDRRQTHRCVISDAVQRAPGRHAGAAGRSEGVRRGQARAGPAQSREGRGDGEATSKPDLVVGFGGGSAMDLAKLVAVLCTGSGAAFADIVGPEKVAGRSVAADADARPRPAPAARPAPARSSPIPSTRTSWRCRAVSCWPISPSSIRT